MWCMQATQNGSDLWLSYWVSHEHKERLRLGDELDSSALHIPSAGHCSLSIGQTGALQGSRWIWGGALISFRLTSFRAFITEIMSQSTHLGCSGMRATALSLTLHSIIAVQARCRGAFVQ